MSDQWCVGTAECLQCAHEWIAVWPLAADDLECPKCGSDDTVRDVLPNVQGEAPSTARTKLGETE